MKRILKHSWRIAAGCTRFMTTLILWTAWLALGVLLAFQITIAASRELTVPSWALTRIERYLAEQGLRVRLGPTKLDTSGRILAGNVTLLHPTLDEPLVEASSVYLRFDSRWLAAGNLELREVDMEGVTLWLPSLRSPTGRSEVVFSDVAANFQPDGADLKIARLSARLGALELTARGLLTLPRPPSGVRRPTFKEQWEAGVRGYLRGVQQAYASLEWIDRFESPRLHVDMGKADGRLSSCGVEFTAARFLLPGSWSRLTDGTVSLHGLVARTTLPIGGSTSSVLQIRAAVSHINAPSDRAADDVDLLLAAIFDPTSLRITPLELKSRVGSLESKPWSARAVSLESSLPARNSTVNALVAGEAWTVGIHDLDTKAGHASLSLNGRLSPPIIDWLGGIVKHPLSEELTLLSRPRLSADIDLDAGWKLRRARGHLAADAVVAHHVTLDQAAASFELTGTSLAFDGIVLKQGPSVARGSYRMDTSSRDFRFILDGRLQPLGISGWFREWWPNFWKNFDFSASTPTASVDIRGRWGRNSDLSVFVAAENARTALRGVWFDRARTRLLVRPYFYEALHFQVNQGTRSARGSFARRSDPEDHTWAALDFDAFSNLDLADGARVIGIEGLGIVEPFHFSQPPELKLSGHLDGPGSHKGEHRNVNFAFYASGPFTYYEFPLDGISVSGTIRDDDIVLDPLATRFAQGSAEGRIRLSGEGAARRLGFDMRLKNAGLGEAIRTLEVFSARRNKREIPAESKLQQRIASGRVDLAMSADGRFEDLLSYHGGGNAELTGADLAEVNLFGLLSQMLKRTLFNFTTLKLDTVHTNFTLQGSKLGFSDMRITGPRAAIDAKGDYLLDHKTLDMKAKLYPFAESDFILSNAVGFVLAPLSQVLEFKLTGPLEDPTWSFVYGPSNFLRALRGSDAGSTEHPPSPSR